MAARNVDVSVRYLLQTIDKGLKTAIGLTGDLTKATRESSIALDQSTATWKTSAAIVSEASKAITGSVADQVKAYDRATVGVKAAADAQARAAKVWMASAGEATKASERVAVAAADTAKIVTNSAAKQSAALSTQGAAWTRSAEKAAAASRAGAAANDIATAASVRGARAIAVHNSALTRLSSGLTKTGQAIQTSGGKMKEFGSAVSSVGTPLAAAAAGSVYLQMKFQAAMETVHTQAGYSQQAVNRLSKEVLAAAPALAQTPQALAAGLYHIASVGVPAAQAMSVLKAAAIGANISGANFDDTANALVTTLKNFPNTAGGARGAMAQLNEIAGAGNLHMEDLVSNLGKVVPAAKNFGLTLRDVGTGIDVMTSHGMGAAQSATALKMAISTMGAPSTAAAKQLATVGLSSTQLASDMRSPNGLVKAFTDLHQHLVDSGDTATQQAQIMAHAFGGGRTAAGVELLVQNVADLNRVYAKLPEGAGALKMLQGAQNEWEKTSQANFDHVKASVESTGISIGSDLEPIVVPALKDVAGVVGTVAHAFEGLPKPAKDVLLGLAAISVVAGPVLKVFGGLTTLVGGGVKLFGKLAGAVAPVDAELSAQEKATIALQDATATLTKALEQQAAAYDALGASAKGAAAGIETATAAEEAGVVAGPVGEAGMLAGGPMGARAAGATATEAEAAAGKTALAGGATAALESQATEGGLMAMMFGKLQIPGILSKIGPALGMAAKGGMFGLIGNQAGGMLGGLLGGKSGAAVGSAAGTGIGIGSMFGPAGMLAGGLIGGGLSLAGKGGVTGALGGAAVGATIGSVIPGIGTLIGGGVGALVSAIFGGPSDTQMLQQSAGALQKEMQAAAKAGNAATLQKLSDKASALASKYSQMGDVSSSALKATNDLATAAHNASVSIAQTKGQNAVAGIEQSVAQSKYKPSGGAIAAATITQLRNLGPQAQDAGAQAIIKFTAGLEAKKQLPEGATNALIADLEQRYGPQLTNYLNRSGAASMQALAAQIQQSKVISAVQAQVDAAHKEWGLMVPDVTVTGQNVTNVMQSTMNALETIVRTKTGQQRADALSALQKMKADQDRYLALSEHAWIAWGATLDAQITIVQNAQSAYQSLTQSVSGGPSLSQYLNAPTGTSWNVHKKKAGGGWVGGDPRSDSTMILAAGDEFVMTGGGQQMMEAYAPGLLHHIAAAQPPHFNAGGFVADTRRKAKPKPATAAGGLPLTWITTGATIDTAAGYGWTEAQFAQHQAGGASNYHAGMSFAELLEAGANAGMRPDLSTILGISEGPTGMPYGTDVYFRTVGGSRIAKASKSDIGSGQAGSRAYTVDLHQGIANAIGWSLGKGPVQVAAAKGGPRTVTSTKYVPAGKGLNNAFDLGYFYGIDPTASGVTSPDAALHAAELGASLKAKKTTIHGAGSSTGTGGGGSANTPAGSVTGHAAQVYTAMMAAANRIIGLPYGHTGGHASWAANNYDCSGAAGYVLHSAGLQPGFGWTGTDVSWGLPGPGKYITRGIRNANSSVEGHEMLKFFGRYLESGGGGPYGQSRVHWDPGWDNPFTVFRHPPGLRRGGYVDQARLGNENEALAHKRPRTRRFAGGGFTTNATHATPKKSPSLPVRTAHPPHAHIHSPSLHLTVGGHAVLPPLPTDLNYTEITQESQVIAMMPVQALSIGTHTAKATLKKLETELGQVAATPNDSKVRQALTALEGTLGKIGKLSYATLQKTQKTLEKHIRTLTHGHPTVNDEHEAARLKQALQLVDYQMGLRAGTLVRAAENEAGALTAAQTKLQRLMDRQNIDSTSAQGTAMLAQYENQAVKVLKNTVSKLQKAYQMAKKAGDTKAMSDIGQKLNAALDNLDQEVTNKVVAQRNKVEAAAQAVVDQATHQATLAQSGEQGLQLQQQLAGTSGTPGGAAQISNYIKSTVVPALTAELTALQKQQAAAKKEGDTTLANQIGEAIASQQNNILQAQLDAQTAIKDAAQQIASNTDTSGVLGVTYQGQDLPDIAGALNGV